MPVAEGDSQDPEILPIADAVTPGSFPGDEKTGALHAFATQPVMMSAHEEMSAREDADMHDSSAPMHVEVDVEVSVDESIPVDKEVQPHQVPPEQLLQDGITVYDASTKQLFRHHAQENQTVGSMRKAFNQLAKCTAIVRDLMGRVVPDDAKITEYQQLAFFPQEDPLSLQQINSKLIELPRTMSMFYQLGAVASDEMMYYLSSIASMGFAKALKPLVVQQVVDLHQEAELWCQWTGDDSPIVSAALWGEHWYPVIMEGSALDKTVHVTPGGRVIWEQPGLGGKVFVHEMLPTAFERLRFSSICMDSGKFDR